MNVSAGRRDQEGRVEKDEQGQCTLPHSAYYGIATARALTQVAVAGRPLSSCPDLIAGLAAVKQAAALANNGLRRLDDRRTRAIMMACEDVRRGMLGEQFVVDVMQPSAVDAADVNANDVIANRSIEHMGQRRGDYAFVDPREHVGLNQDAASVYVLATRVAVHGALHQLLERLRPLAQHGHGDTAGIRQPAAEAVLAAIAELTELHAAAVSVSPSNAVPGHAGLLCAKLADLTGVPALLQSPDALIMPAYLCSLSQMLDRLGDTLGRLMSGDARHVAGDAHAVALRGAVSAVRGHALTVQLAADDDQAACLPVMVTAVLDALKMLRGGCSLLHRSA